MSKHDHDDDMGMDDGNGSIRFLPVKLTHEEREAKERLLPQLLANAQAKEEEIKAVSGTLRGELKAIEGRIAATAACLLRGYEVRAVELVTSVEGNKATIRRRDTGEVIDTRPATDLERQGTIPGTESPAPVADDGQREAIDSDGVVRTITAKQAAKMTAALERGKAFHITVDSARVRLVSLVVPGQPSEPVDSLGLTEPAPPPSVPRPVVHGIVKGTGQRIPVTSEALEREIARAFGRGETVRVTHEGVDYDVAGLSYPAPESAEAVIDHVRDLEADSSRVVDTEPPPPSSEIEADRELAESALEAPVATTKVHTPEQATKRVRRKKGAVGEPEVDTFARNGEVH